MITIRCISEGPLFHQKYRLEDNGVTFGRAEGNQLILQDESVSSFHGIFIQEPEGVLVRDQGSTNGIRVNDREISESALWSGDKLEIGNLLFEVQVDAVPTRLIPLEAAFPQPPPRNPVPSPPAQPQRRKARPSPAPETGPPPNAPPSEMFLYTQPSPVHLAVAAITAVVLVILVIAYAYRLYA